MSFILYTLVTGYKIYNYIETADSYNEVLTPDGVRNMFTLDTFQIVLDFISYFCLLCSLYTWRNYSTSFMYSISIFLINIYLFTLFLYIPFDKIVTYKDDDMNNTAMSYYLKMMYLHSTITLNAPAMLLMQTIIMQSSRLLTFFNQKKELKMIIKVLTIIYVPLVLIIGSLVWQLYEKIIVLICVSIYVVFLVINLVNIENNKYLTIFKYLVFLGFVSTFFKTLYDLEFDVLEFCVIFVMRLLLLITSVRDVLISIIITNMSPEEELTSLSLTLEVVNVNDYNVIDV
jgi:hypothetical protein